MARTHVKSRALGTETGTGSSQQEPGQLLTATAGCWSLPHLLADKKAATGTDDAVPLKSDVYGWGVAWFLPQQLDRVLILTAH